MGRLALQFYGEFDTFEEPASVTKQAAGVKTE